MSELAELTVYQRDLLWKVQAWSRQNDGERPTFQALKEYTRAGSTSVVAYNLRKLRERGLVSYRDKVAKSVKVTDAGMEFLGLLAREPVGESQPPAAYGHRTPDREEGEFLYETDGRGRADALEAMSG